MKATIRVISYMNDTSQCDVNGHKLQFGGAGDGYCYAHQSFNCLDNLSEEEKDAIDNAEYQDSEEGRHK